MQTSSYSGGRYPCDTGRDRGRTYSDNKGPAPRPSEQGVAPPHIRKNEIEFMTPYTLKRWLDLFAQFPFEVKLHIEPVQLHARQANSERMHKNLKSENAEELFARAKDYRSWISADEAQIDGCFGDKPPKEYIACNCTNCATVPATHVDDSSYYYRLYGTTFYIGKICYSGIKRGHMSPGLAFPEEYGVFQLMRCIDATAASPDGTNQKELSK